MRLKNANNQFKEEFSLERRKQISKIILDKYPERVPVIVQKVPSSDIPDINRKKYLVPRDLTVGQFIMTIRKRITITPEKAMFIFVNNILPTTSDLMGSLYNQHKDAADNLLYVAYSSENTFGS